jgi:hypothetical protein
MMDSTAFQASRMGKLYAKALTRPSCAMMETFSNIGLLLFRKIGSRRLLFAKTVA